MGTSEEILYEVAERVATITINRPKARNSLNKNVSDGLNSMLDQAVADDNVGSIVITGAGGKAFCSGADLGGSFSGDASFIEQHEARGDFAGYLIKMNKCKKPILAAVEGFCLAGGIGVCLSCDVVIASDDSKFGLPEIKRGLWPYMVTAVLIKNVGRKKAIELCMTGELISAAEAERIGMINHCVPKDQFKERVDETAKKLASFSTAIMGLGKSSFYRIADMEFGAALDFLSTQLTINTQTEDIKEGIAAFMEKRDPKWKGR
ncbi:enoyl-CoA hydratase/isomerase family protein [Thermodesulfobacteriota bacterium]